MIYYYRNHAYLGSLLLSLAGCGAENNVKMISDVASSKSAPQLSENVLTDSLSGVWYGLSEETIKVTITATDGAGNEIDWRNSFKGAIPLKDQAMLWLMSKAVDGGEMHVQQAYSFRMQEDSGNREKLWFDFCQAPLPDESSPLELAGNTINLPDADVGATDRPGIQHILNFSSMFFLPEENPETLPEMGPIPVEIINNSHVTFEPVERSFRISRPLADLENHFANRPGAIAEPGRPVEGPPPPALPPESMPERAATRAIDPDAMLHITLTQSMERQWIKIKNTSTDLLGSARYGDQSFDVGCFFLMQANTSGNLSGVVDINTLHYHVASANRQTEWRLTEDQHSFLVPLFYGSQNNRYASFESQVRSENTLAPEQIASLEAQQSELFGELRVVSNEYFTGCLGRPPKPIYDPDKPAIPVPLPIAAEDPQEPAPTLSEEQCLALQETMDDLEKQVSTVQQTLDEAYYGKQDYFSTEWGNLTFERFDVEGETHDILFHTLSNDIFGDGSGPNEKQGPIEGAILLNLAP